MRHREMSENSNHGDLRFAGISDRMWLVRASIFGLRGCATPVFASFVGFCALLVVWLTFGSSRSQELSQEPGVDWPSYAQAAEFCRGDVERPMSLSHDKRILCFDGWIVKDQDVSLAKDLADEGLFVVRSFGGDILVALALSDLLRDRRATVVVYDYCNSSCAGYFLIASTRAFVLKGTLVAWHPMRSGVRDCPSLTAAADGGPKRLERSPCSDVPPERLWKYERVKLLNQRFFAERTFDENFEFPPESPFIRRVLTIMFESSGDFPDVAWTWNPKYYKEAIKTKVIYEAYPESQREVSTMVKRLHLRPVIYDP